MSVRSFPLVVLVLFLSPAAAMALPPSQDDGPIAEDITFARPEGAAEPGGPTRLLPPTPFIRGGGAYQFDADLDDGGELNVSRFYIEGGVPFDASPRVRITPVIGYGRDQFDFSGSSGLAGLDPWSGINSLRLAARIRWSVDDKWDVFAIPSLRFNWESGAKIDRSFSGGSLFGASYRFGDKLTIGPGFGILSEIEDDPQFFPILVIEWKITDTLVFKTAGGLAATRGPGLELGWTPSRDWEFGIGGRFEQVRFRLDEDGSFRNGIGEERGFPLYGFIRYAPSQRLRLALLGGVTFGNELKLEDSDGRLIAETDQDPAPFIGAAFSLRF